MLSSVTPPLLLAQRWESHVDPTGWWLSEKLDGVRAYWNGAKFLTRSGKSIVAPEWFLSALPRGISLDGELFGGRKNFEGTLGIVRSQDKPHGWREIAFVAFDAPECAGTFEERLGTVTSIAGKAAAAHFRVHPHVRCTGVDHLRKELARVESLGGEGLMLRKAGSHYERGRSSTLLKVKTFHDAEAVVVGYEAGEGRYAGMLGALVCELPNGRRFKIGSGFTDSQRTKPVPIGTVVTFRYQEITAQGAPRFPTYVRTRTDFVPAPAPKPDVEPEVAKRVFTKGGATWEIALAGKTHRVWQRRGLAVKMATASFETCVDAWRDADSLIDARRAAGWSEVVSSGSE